MSVLLPQLRQSLDCVPYELLPIIVDYAYEIPHTWQPVPPSSDIRLRIVGNFVQAYDYGCCFRISSCQSFRTGPHRWRITGSFSDTEWSSFAVGITSADPRPTELPGRLCWTDAQSALIAVAKDCCLALHGGSMKLPPMPVAIRPNATTYSVAIRIDVDNRTMNVAVESTKRVNRPIRFRIPDCMDILDCRPCVVVSDYLDATIGSCLDDGRSVRKPIDISFPSDLDDDD